MKVMLVHYNGGDGGGAESAVRDQRRALELCGHEVHVCFQRPERDYARIKPDVVHFHTVHVGMGLGVLEWAQARRIPHCISLHDYWPFCGDRMLMKYGAMPSRSDEPCSAVEGVCDGQCINGPAGPDIPEIVNGSPTVIFSEYAGDIFRRHGIRVDAVIPHAIDTDVFCPKGPPPVEPVILTMSAWAAFNTKGMHVLQAALKREHLSAKCITGVAREQVPGLLRTGNIFVFPSTYQETWGLCLTEAMSTGLACIASSVAGPKAQIRDGFNGLLVPPRDADALADALRRLVNDRDERERLGANARAWALKNADLRRMGRDYTRFYEGLLGGQYGA